MKNVNLPEHPNTTPPMPRFLPQMKLADLLATDHYLILTLPRLGIPLGFGEKSVATVCAENHVPVDFMLLLCDVYSFNDFTPDPQQLNDTDMSPLVPYLNASHRYYIDSYIPHINEHVRHVADKLGARFGEMLTKFFDDYAAEVADHFRYEETEVFPFLADKKNRKAGIPTKIIKRISHSHTEIEDKLCDLSQIVYKYLPPEMASDEVIELLFDIFRLADDLRKHEQIEERILLPYIESLAE